MPNRFSRPKSRASLGSSITFIAAILVSAHSYAEKSSSMNQPLFKNKAQVVAIVDKAEPVFTLWADYYQGEEQANGVIVLHDCYNDRYNYRAVAENLAQQGLHTLSLDLRGYGESISATFSREIAKQQSQDIIQFQSKMALITAHWPKDLLLAYNFLREKITKNQHISVVTSGCSSAYAIDLAEKVSLNAMVMITPQMSYIDKERYKSLVDIPSYFITSSHHQNSYSLSQELFRWNGDQRSKIQIFKGSYHSHSLIGVQKSLAHNITLWLNSIQ